MAFMPRKRRLQFPGAMYHVMNRGDRREDIFLDDVDRQDFLKTLAEACQKTGWQAHAVFQRTWPLLSIEPQWIRADRLQGEHDIQADTPEGRGRFEACMERRRWEETDAEVLETLQRGWCLGSEEFKMKMLAMMEGQVGEHHPGQLRRESAAEKAERIIAEELARLQWTEASLASLRKCDSRKLDIAARAKESH